MAHAKPNTQSIRAEGQLLWLLWRLQVPGWVWFVWRVEEGELKGWEDEEEGTMKGWWSSSWAGNLLCSFTSTHLRSGSKECPD